MHTKIIEVENKANHGKFLVASFDDAELARRSSLPEEAGNATPLLVQLERKLNEPFRDLFAVRWILDLQTHEGAAFEPKPHGDASADLEKHAIWVCPLFEPFLWWLYRAGPPMVQLLPEYLALPPSSEVIWAGYRRSGVHAPEIPRIRKEILSALAAASAVPVSQVQIAAFIERSLQPQDHVLWRYFFGTLTSRDQSKYMQALLCDSGRYAAVPTAAGLGLLPRT